MFLITLLAVSLTAPVPKDKPVLYYPTIVGTKRVLDVTLGNKTVEAFEEVTKVEEKDGTSTVTVDWTAFGQTTSGVYEVSAKKVQMVKAKELGNPLLLDLGVKAGETWTSEATINKQKVITTYTLCKVEEVEVPAGKFKAIPVTEQKTNSDLKTTKWYAADVGMVKMTSESKTMKSAQVLKSFTPGKEEKK